MAVWKVILRYKDMVSGLGWTITNFRDAATASNAKTVADVWNTAYLGACGEDVRLVDGRISDEALYRDETVYRAEFFAQDEGQIVGPTTEIGSYAQFRGYGTPANGGSSGWKLHGISATLTLASALDLAAPEVLGLESACLVYLQQYRKAATANFPIVNPPTDFPTGFIGGMYFKRLGRPFGLPGQSR